jgi:hypothetical protein
MMVGHSPWAGYSRRPLRAALAAVASVDAVGLAVTITTTGPGPLSHPDAPAFLIELGDYPAIVFPIAFLAVCASWALCRREGSLAAGGAALLLLALLCESHAALVGGPARSFFTGGAVLLGWIAGAGASRLMWRDRDARREDVCGEAGAVAVLAATYVAAGLSKLVHDGASWADDTTLRAIVLTHHRVDDTSIVGAYEDVVVESPALGFALAAATLVIQLGAVAYVLSPRLRMAWGVLLIGFHLHTLALLHLIYAENVALLLVFSFPWPTLHGRRGEDPSLAVGDPARARGVAIIAVAAIATFAALVWLTPIRDYTALHHRPGL